MPARASGDQPSRRSLLDLMVLLQQVWRQARRHTEQRRYRSWLLGLPASESAPVDRLRWLAERFAFAQANRPRLLAEPEWAAAVLTPAPDVPLTRSLKMKKQTSFDTPPWLALRNRVQQELGVDLRAHSLAEVIDFALDRLEAGDGTSRATLARLVSLLIQMEAVPLSPPTDGKADRTLAHLVERDRLRQRAHALAETRQRGQLMRTARPTIAPPPAPRSAFFAESDTEYLSYWEACAGGPAALDQYYRLTGKRALVCWTFSKSAGTWRTARCFVDAWRPIRR